MHVLSSKRFAVCVLVAGLAVGAAYSWACDVPVFRYGLERWEADYYDVIVFHRGAMEANDEAALAKLAQRIEEEQSYANAILHVVDIEAAAAEGLMMPWGDQPEPGMPHVSVRYPKARPTRPDMWSGPLSDFDLDALLDSPVRQEIAKRILDGHTAVWVLLGIGDPEKDDAAEEVLAAELDRMNETLVLPELTEESDFGAASKTPLPELRVAFSMLRLSRTNPEEDMFVRMLVGSESDLHTFDEPMAFPIFARGRVLYALVGKGINARTIGAACRFITGPCACEIKDENPGTDVLMNVNWGGVVDTTLTKIALTPAVPSLSSVLEAASRESEVQDQEQEVAETATAQEAAATEPPVMDKPGTSVVRNVVWVLAVGIVFVVGASAFLLHKS